MLKTTLCRQLGIEYPLFSAGMGGGMAGPELVAAVSNAGESCSLVHDIKPAAQIVHDVIREAEEALEELQRR